MGHYICCWLRFKKLEGSEYSLSSVSDLNWAELNVARITWKLEDAHLSPAECCCCPGRWHTGHRSIHLSSAQTPERRSRTPRRRSTDTPPSQRPASASSAASRQPRIPAWFPPSHPRFSSRVSVLRRCLVFRVPFSSSSGETRSFLFWDRKQESDVHKPFYCPSFIFAPQCCKSNSC